MISSKYSSSDCIEGSQDSRSFLLQHKFAARETYLDVSKMAKSFQVLLLREVHILQCLKLLLCICELAQPVKSFSRAPEVLALLQCVPRLDCKPQLHDQSKCGSDGKQCPESICAFMAPCTALHLHSSPAAQMSAVLLQLHRLPSAALPYLPMLAD